MARMVVTSLDYVKDKYNLKELKSLETLVADAVQIVCPTPSLKGKKREMKALQRM